MSHAVTTPPASVVEDLRGRLTELAGSAEPVALRGAIAVLEAIGSSQPLEPSESPPRELAIKTLSKDELLAELERESGEVRNGPKISMEEALAQAEKLAFEKLATLRS